MNLDIANILYVKMLGYFLQLLKMSELQKK